MCNLFFKEGTLPWKLRGASPDYLTLDSDYPPPAMCPGQI